jgi:hypothetical protein
MYFAAMERDGEVNSIGGPGICCGHSLSKEDNSGEGECFRFRGGKLGTLGSQY